MKEIRAYAIRVRGYDGHETIVHHISAGKAKSEFLRSLDMDSITYTDLRARCEGGPCTSVRFRENAKYRGIPFAYVGMVVEVEGVKGRIIGHNSSCNLDVLFQEGKWEGQVLNCHPNWMIKYYDKQGNCIKSFGAGVGVPRRFERKCTLRS